jgi:hypothetical protein
MKTLFALAGRLLSIKTGLWLPLALGLALCLSYGLLRAEKHHSAKVETRLHQTESAYAQFQADVRSKTALAQAQDAANAARVEAAQSKATQEVSDDYQTQLAALRARYNALSLRAGKTGSDSGRGGKANLPVVSDPASGVDGAASSAPVNEFNAEANALQLKALQGWVSSVSSIDRGE